MFEREASSENHAPGSTSIILLENQKYLAAIYFIWRYLSIFTTFLRYLPILRHRTQKGLTTPLTRRVASICYLFAGAVYVV